MVKYGLYNGQEIQNSDVILRQVSINGNVCGEFAEFSIAQMYENKGESHIDGVYIFPIPDTAVITGFEAMLGGKTLKALVEDKRETEKMFLEGVEKGLNPITIESYEENIFKISIGSIMPGETVKITVSYLDQLLFENNKFKLYLPAITSPKNINEEEEEANIENKDYKFNFNLLIESLSKLNISSPSHEISIQSENDTVYRVTLDKEEKLDKNFTLIMEENKNNEYSGMLYRYDEDDKGILYLRIIPKLEASPEDSSKNYIFLMDLSESMEGYKFEEAKDALELCIRNLDDGDTFNLIAFSENLNIFSEDGNVEYSEDNVYRATEWINNLNLGKEANIFEAIKVALKSNEQGTIILFTDDMVENENEILDFVEANLGENRIFPIGIDTSVNSYFINKLAHIGYGKPEFIYPGERIDDMILRQFNRITNPQLDVLSIDWGALKVEQTYPRTIEYLYDREPFTFFAKVRGDIGGKVIIKGRVGEEDYEKTIDLDKIDLEGSIALIEKAWSRKRIESIREHMMAEKGDRAEAMRSKIIEISKEFGIISSETSFIMLEQIEEPVLGMSINNLIPVNITEEAMQDISEAYFLDSPSFLYEVDLREIMEEEGLDKSVAKEKIKYDRENLLRTIAKYQSVDGGFYNFGEKEVYKKLNSTVLSLLAFLLGDEDINIYINQINKSLKFIIDYLDYDIEVFDERISILSLTTLKLALEDDILKPKYKQNALEAEAKLQELIEEKRYIELESIYSCKGIKDMKNIVSFILGLTKAYSKNAHRTLNLEEKNNLNEIAKVAIAKTL